MDLNYIGTLWALAKLIEMGWEPQMHWQYGMVLAELNMAGNVHEEAERSEEMENKELLETVRILSKSKKTIGFWRENACSESTE